MQSQITTIVPPPEREEDLGIDEQYQIPDELWERIRVLIPPPPPPKKNRIDPVVREWMTGRL